ncbi:hypothetical protein KPB2_5366 [Klebsiella pneumoniae Kb677]|nr:hypothetical protein KPB2_5366 [Klebsiella pneumoniae Kb677]
MSVRMLWLWLPTMPLECVQKWLSRVSEEQSSLFCVFGAELCVFEKVLMEVSTSPPLSTGSPVLVGESQFQNPSVSTTEAEQVEVTQLLEAAK